MLKKCIGDPNSILSIEGLEGDDNICYEEHLQEILDRIVKKFTNKEVAVVKDLWKNHLVERETWEDEANKKSHYPLLFASYVQWFLLITKIMSKI